MHRPTRLTFVLRCAPTRGAARRLSEDLWTVVGLERLDLGEDRLRVHFDARVASVADLVSAAEFVGPEVIAIRGRLPVAGERADSR